MGRLVRVPRPAIESEVQLAGFDGMLSGTPAQMQSAVPGDNYLERAAKYVPAEVLAFFIFINAILDQAVRTGGKSAFMAGFPVTIIAVGAFIAAMVLVPVFVWYVREEGDAWITNAFVSFLAFPFWAYAIGAVAFADYHDGNLAAILLASFTVVSGLVSPPALRARRRKGQVAETPKDSPRLVETLPGLSA